MTPDTRRSGSSSSALSKPELAVCEYWADAETMRCRPNNPSAYRAVVLARKRAEMLALRHVQPDQEPAARIVAEHVEIAVEVEPMIDPLLALAAWREGVTQGKLERAELLARLEAEQAKDPSWK